MELWVAIVLIIVALILGAAAAALIVYKIAFNKGVEQRKKDEDSFRSPRKSRDYKEIKAR